MKSNNMSFVCSCIIYCILTVKEVREKKITRKRKMHLRYLLKEIRVEADPRSSALCKDLCGPYTKGSRL